MASPLVADKVDADGFARCVFDRLVVSNIWRAKNLDFAIVGFACFYRVERRCPQNSSNCSPVRVQHASRNADVFVAGLDEQCGAVPGPPPFATSSTTVKLLFILVEPKYKAGALLASIASFP